MKKYVEIISLPTKEYTGIVSHGTGVDNLLHTEESAENAVLNIGGQHQHLYFVSDDKIKEGDCILQKLPSCSYKIHTNITFETAKISNEDNLDVKKIIATTNKSLKYTVSPYLFENGGACKSKNFYLPQPPQSFIEKYCKLGGINKVMVEYERIDTYPKTLDGSSWGKLVPKVSSSNEITIHSIKDSEKPKTRFSYDDITHAIAYGHSMAKQGLSHHQTLINYKQANNIKYVEKKVYGEEEINEMLFSISTTLCWDDKDPEELIKHCQDVVNNIRDKLT